MNTINYFRFDYYERQHHLRFKKRVEGRLICQECGGAGGKIDQVLDYDGFLSGPWESCGWCEGTGYVTPWLRGLWLRFQQKRKENESSDEC